MGIKPGDLVEYQPHRQSRVGTVGDIGVVLAYAGNQGDAIQPHLFEVLWPDGCISFEYEDEIACINGDLDGSKQSN